MTTVEVGVYRHILVALDGSADSTTALRHAINLAYDQNARLTLLTVLPQVPAAVGQGIVPPQEAEEAHDRVIKEALSIIPRDIGVTTRRERGEVPQTILKVVAEDRYDLLVMGSHGHSRVHRALLGSVSERVLHKAAVPVLMLRSLCGD